MANKFFQSISPFHYLLQGWLNLRVQATAHFLRHQHDLIRDWFPFLSSPKPSHMSRLTSCKSFKDYASPISQLTIQIQYQGITLLVLQHFWLIVTSSVWLLLRFHYVRGFANMIRLLPKTQLPGVEFLRVCPTKRWPLRRSWKNLVHQKLQQAQHCWPGESNSNLSLLSIRVKLVLWAGWEVHYKDAMKKNLSYQFRRGA